MLASRLDLPPSQLMLGAHQNVSDGEVALFSSYVKAHIMPDKAWRGIAASWALTLDDNDGSAQATKDMLLRVLPCT
jgi:hypothetical protein